MIYGAGGPPAHFEAVAIRILGLPTSEHLLDAVFDGAKLHLICKQALCLSRDARLDCQANCHVEMAGIAFQGWFCQPFCQWRQAQVIALLF